MTHNVISNELAILQMGLMKLTKHEAFIQATTTTLQLLTVPHKESAAGSNPREFQGIKSATNKKILESLLTNFNIIFTAHSQGVTLTAIGVEYDDEGNIVFEDACLVNGLQTVTILRIMVLLKSYQTKRGKLGIHKKIGKNISESWHDFIDEVFSTDAAEQLHAISIDNINNILTWLHKPQNKRFLESFNDLSLEQILALPVNIKITILDKLPEPNKENSDSNRTEELLRFLGMSIAEANNETQKVKADDLFGTKHRELLEGLFQNVNEPYKVEFVHLEYDRFEAKNKLKIIHVLDILRAILPTTLIMEEGQLDEDTFIASYGNHRERVYNLFNRCFAILNNDKHSKHPGILKVFKILRTLIPDIIEVRNEAENAWQEIRSKLSEGFLQEEWRINLRSNTQFHDKIYIDDGRERTNEEEINKAIKEQFGFSFRNAFPLLVYATRSAINIDSDLNGSYKLDSEMVTEAVYDIYSRMIELRLSKSFSSTSNMFRDPSLYRYVTQDIWKTMKKRKIGNHDYTIDFRERI